MAETEGTEGDIQKALEAEVVGLEVVGAAEAVVVLDVEGEVEVEVVEAGS